MPRGRSQQPYSLKVTDCSDRELLAIARDLQNRDGEIDIERVATKIWPGTKRDADKLWHARHCVALRFAWLRRLGVVEKNGRPGIWELTSLGEEFAAGKLKSSKVAQQAGDLYDEVEEDQAALMRREFQFRFYRRRWR